MYTQYTDVTKAYIRSVLVLLGANDNDDLDTAVDGIFNVERSLAEVSVECSGTYSRVVKCACHKTIIIFH